MPPGPYPRIEKFDAVLDEIVAGEPPQILATGLGTAADAKGRYGGRRAVICCSARAGAAANTRPARASVADPAARNGALTRDPQGRLVVTAGQARRVTRTEAEAE